MDNSPAIEVSHHWPQYLIAITSALLAVSTGLHSGWPSPAIPRMLDRDFDFNISTQEISYIIVLSPMGYILGCPITAILLDKMGRKFTIFILAGPQIAAWLLIANSTGVYMLYVARFTSGVAEGGAITSLPVYIAEISEPKIRGALGLSYPVSILFGKLLITCYGSYMPLKSSAYISVMFPVLFMVTFIWMPESPYFLIMKGRTEKARKSLRCLRSMTNVEEELVRLTSDIQRQLSEPKTIWDVFAIKSNLKAFFILIGLRSLQQFTGGATLTFYNQVIFKKASASISFIFSSIIYNATVLVVTFCSTFVIDKIGRRILLMISTTGAGFCLLIEGLYFSCQYYECYNLSSFELVPLIAMLLYTVARGIGLTPIPTMMAAELFSASVKAKAICMVNIYYALAISIASKLFQFLNETFSMQVPFFMFVILSIVGMVFLYYCVPETKGKTLEEIQQRLKGNPEHR